MDIQVNLDPAQIEQTVTKAIIDSSIGKHINDAVNAALKDLTDIKHYNSFPYRTGLARFVQGQIERAISSVIDTEYAESIKAAIRTLLTDEIIGEIVKKAVAQYIKTLSER